MADRRLRAAFSKAFLLVLVLALVSYIVYFGSRQIGNRSVGQFLATLFGTIYFCSIFFGPLYIYTDGYLRGVRFGGRILASSLIPLLWMTKDVLACTGSHPLLECLYWYLNPLSIWMIFLLAIEMGLGTLIARYILRRRGQPGRVITLAPVIAIVIGSVTFAGILAWGQGESLYSIYLEGYRLLFGSGL